MAKTPEAAKHFLDALVPASTARASGEAKDIQALIDAQGGGFKVEPWDWEFYSEQVRKAKYDLNQSEIKPYFELNNVLENGVFYAAHELYGLTFKERKDLPVYQQDVRVFEVFDADAKPLALWYCDYFKRDNKNGGAWMDVLVGQSKLLGQLPVVFNVANFDKPAPGQPALLSFDDVTTMFHEFGHGLHGMSEPVGHAGAARLCRVPLAVQRALGQLSFGLCTLRAPLQDRRTHACRSGRKNRQVEELQRGLRFHGDSRCVRARS
jgi:peptidyl-dipeptidase Dcp